MRVAADETIVIAKMNPSVVTVLLGGGAGDWSGKVTEENRERLEALGRGIFVVRAGGEAIEPVDVKVSAELNSDIAFILSYPAAGAWPLTIEAVFCKDFGPEFNGSIRAYGPPAGPTERQGKPLGTIELTRDDRVLTLSSR